jgi:hypothetical protein
MSDTFYHWIRDQKDRPDATGWFALQVERRLDFVPSLGSDEDKWHRAIGEVKGSFRKPMLAAFETAWNEWKCGESSAVASEDVEEFDPNETMRVVSTVGRLRRSVERNMESGEVEEEETLAVHRFRGPVAHVGMKGQTRVNLGDYEHIEVQTFVSCPCYPEELGDMADFLSRWTGNRFNRELETMMDIKGGSGARKEILEAHKQDPFVPKKKGFDETVRRISKDADGVVDDEPKAEADDGVEYEPVVDDGKDPLF